jgi:hypothetical protein
LPYPIATVAEKPGLNRDFKQDSKQEGTSVVVGGEAPPPNSHKRNRLDYSFNLLNLDGTGINQEPVQASRGNNPVQPAGAVEPTVSSPAAGTASPSPLEPEYLDEPAQPANDTPEAPLGSTSVQARELATFYFTSLGSPPQLKGRWPAWEKEAATLLKSHSMSDAKSAATYALGHKFWQAKMMRFDPTDPFTYFCLKVPELLAQTGYGVQTPMVVGRAAMAPAEPA